MWWATPPTPHASCAPCPTGSPGPPDCAATPRCSSPRRRAPADAAGRGSKGARLASLSTLASTLTFTPDHGVPIRDHHHRAHRDHHLSVVLGVRLPSGAGRAAARARPQRLPSGLRCPPTPPPAPRRSSTLRRPLVDRGRHRIEDAKQLLERVGKVIIARVCGRVRGPAGGSSGRSWPT